MEKILKNSKKPLIIAGGGVHYASACNTLQEFSKKYKIPVAETSAGKGALAWNHPGYVGAIGVTGSNAANNLARQADTVLAIGTRLNDFISGSRALFSDKKLVQLNVARFDAIKHNAYALWGDAKLGIDKLDEQLDDWKASNDWFQESEIEASNWNDYYEKITSINNPSDKADDLPTDAQVLGEVKRNGEASDIVVCAAGSLPGELHKLWRTEQIGGYHSEYGFSCMGYEIAGGLGVKIAQPEREVIVLVGDGSYLMLNSELATSVMLGQKIIAVVLEIRTMFLNQTVTLADLLLMFLYLEVLAMVRVFWNQQSISITLPLLIAITALARFIILQGKEMDPTALVYEAVAIVLIAAAIVILRLRHSDKLGLKKKKTK